MRQGKPAARIVGMNTAPIGPISVDQIVMDAMTKVTF